MDIGEKACTFAEINNGITLPGRDQVFIVRLYFLLNHVGMV